MHLKDFTEYWGKSVLPLAEECSKGVEHYAEFKNIESLLSKETKGSASEHNLKYRKAECKVRMNEHNRKDWNTAYEIMQTMILVEMALQNNKDPSRYIRPLLAVLTDEKHYLLNFTGIEKEVIDQQNLGQSLLTALTML